MKIVQYNNSSSILVEFLDKYNHQVHTTYANFKKGQVRNPYDCVVFGVGMIGSGRHPTKKDGKTTKTYNAWCKILMRCYSKKYQNLYYSSYKGCTVCKEWHNFQMFADWYEENLYEILDERMEIDKDILIEGNKVYSPETCLIVPQSINMLFKRHSIKGRDLPIGIYQTKLGKYNVCFTYKGVSNHFGGIATFEQACEIYKECKEKYLKQIAEDYKQHIPKKLYDALINYNVICEI